MKSQFSFHTLSAIIGVALLVTGCATPKSSSDSEQKDSIRVEYRERIIKVPDTVFVEIPAQTAERTTADSVSNLENDYATSEARINPDGTLYHDLRTKPQKRPVATEKEIQIKDSTVYVDRYKTKTVTKVVEVKRKRSWWEQTCIYGFCASIIYVIYRCRRKIFQAAVRVFLKK